MRLDNERPFADVTITGYQRGSDPTVHPAEDCGTFEIGDVIFGEYTATDQHFRALTLSVQPDPNPIDPMGPTTYPAIPTGGVMNHTWKLDTKKMRACGYTVRLWTEDRTIVNSGYIGWERRAYVGFCLTEVPKKGEETAHDITDGGYLRLREAKASPSKVRDAWGLALPG